MCMFVTNMSHVIGKYIYFLQKLNLSGISSTFLISSYAFAAELAPFLYLLNLKYGSCFFFLNVAPITLLGKQLAEVPSYEPRHEKTGFLPMLKQSRRSASQLLCLCFRYKDSTISTLLISEISSF